MEKAYVKKVNILGFEIDNMDKTEAVETIEGLSSTGRFHLIVTANPLILMKARRDPEYAKTLNNASLILPDGIGLIWASKLLRRPLKTRVAGISLLLSIIYFANELGKSIFFLGGKPIQNSST